MQFFLSESHTQLLFSIKAEEGNYDMAEGGGGEYSSQCLVRECSSVLQTLTLFQTKIKQND